VSLTILEKKKKGFILTPQERRQFKFLRTKEALEKEYGRKLKTMQVRYLERGIRKLGYWDIETSDFNPHQNFIICYVFYVRDVLTNKIDKYEYHITKDDISKAVKNSNFNFDEKLLQKMSECMHYCDQIVGHFSTKFDMNYFRSRCILTKQLHLIPDYQVLTFGDTWRMMKQSMKAPRNTLNNFALQTSGKSDKTFVDLEYWYKIKFKDSPDWQKAMNYIVKHCRADVKMTMKGHKDIETFNAVSGVLV
jgi:hypothetical protein